MAANTYLFERVRTFLDVVDFSVVQKLGKEEKYASQKDEYSTKFVPKSAPEIKGAEQEIVSNIV